MVKENNFLSVFSSLAERTSDPAWLLSLRERAAASFEALEFPTARTEEWKYTNAAPILKLDYRSASGADGKGVTAEGIEKFSFAETRHSRLVFINGFYSRELSDVSVLSGGITVSNFSNAQAEVIRRHLGAYADYHRQVFTALNTASINEGAFVHIPDGKILETPIHLLFVSTSPGANTISHPRALVVAGRGAMATVIESFVSIADDVYFTNAVTEVVTHEGAAIDHYRLQEESERGFHIGTTQVHQERASSYSSCALSIGSRIARHNLNVTLADENTQTTLNGLYVVTGDQLSDSHLLLDHAKPHGASSQLYKGILDDRARAVFNGKVIVREGALLTDARQLNKNLLLSGDAHVDTKPELEIFADDVKCAHGATVGQLEDDELFYLSTRGLDPEKARALLTYGFAEDVISKIKVASVRRQLDEFVLTKLHQNLEVS
ncbi:MAG TPA: Fe-S cluster assembly protein SufD [Blastocatellia bacterium]|nr:Fe-S cluster assembly protein SufD [Blastocatellia bacterium]